jgi:hypothetical protein
MSTVPIRSLWRLSVMVTTALMALMAPAAIVRAQDEGAAAAPVAPVADPAASVVELNRRALAEYDNLNFDEAKNQLKSALALCDRNGLGSHPVRAQTYLTLGVVMLAADAQHRDVAVAQFRRAIQIQPDIRLPERVANPEVQQAFAEAQTAARASLLATRAPTPSASADKRATSPAGDREAGARAESDLEAEAEAPAGGQRPRWFIGFGVGSGVGWASGSGEVNSKVTLPSGFEPSSVIHLAPELGYFLRPDLMVSLQGRIQFISAATAERDPSGTACGADRICSPSHGATALFAKATWFLAPTGLRPYLTGALGVGQIRHVVSLPDHTDCGTDAAHPVTCVDTTAAGPVLLGPGAGLMVEVARHFALTLGASTLIGLSAFTFHLDVGGGIAVEL